MSFDISDSVKTIQSLNKTTSFCDSYRLTKQFQIFVIVTEQQLIEDLKNSKGSAFSKLVELHQGSVVNTCYGFLMNKEEAEDIAQEVFIEVFKSVEAFKEDSSLATWLYRIAVNKSIDAIRKKKRKKRIQNLIGFYDKEDNQVIDLAANTPNPEDILEQKERLEILHKATERLPSNQKIAFTLNKFETLKASEIAEIMEISLSSVEALLFRAKKNLKVLLKDYYTKTYT